MRLGAEAREAERLMASLEEQLRQTIRRVPDYPKKGVLFMDLTTLWKDGKLSRKTIDALQKHARAKKPDKILGIEARGFIVGAPLADRLGVGFVAARKAGRLPSQKLSIDYELEYGTQSLEVHSDSFSNGERVLIVDDLLATGGTSRAAKELVEKLGGRVVGFAFIAELTSMKGREKLTGCDVYSLVRYDSEE